MRWRAAYLVLPLLAALTLLLHNLPLFLLTGLLTLAASQPVEALLQVSTASHG